MKDTYLEIYCKTIVKCVEKMLEQDDDYQKLSNDGKAITLILATCMFINKVEKNLMKAR